MITKVIRLSSIDDIKRFIVEVTKCAFDVDLSSGRYLVDAKSIMGIFSLDLKVPVKVIMHTDDEHECAAFYDFLTRLTDEPG